MTASPNLDARRFRINTYSETLGRGEKLTDFIEADLRQFVQTEEENLWRKLRDFGSSQEVNRKERIMQDLMESHWLGLGRGDIHKEIPAGSGRIDLLAIL